jgi:hypothetical protein
MESAWIAEKLVNTAVPTGHTRNYPKTVKGFSGSALEESERSRGKSLAKVFEVVDWPVLGLARR